jgi:putative glycosyltransferase (TIGR04348 family)
MKAADATAAKQVVIVSPALSDANNGNWQTARRWRDFLAPHFPTRIVKAWPDALARLDRIMLALHARRSAPAIAAWAQMHGRAHDAPGLGVVLTGTDLYRDIHSDASARKSLDLARRLVVLHELGPLELPESLRPKTRAIFQSTPARQTLPKTARHLRAIMVGHLREEKSPTTLFEAARLLANHVDIRIDHIGAPLDPSLAALATKTMAACPAYRWLGGLPHEATRRRIQRAHLLIHASRMEGGAHVVMEAVRSGTPVVASRIAGNIGMLGATYEGYFEWADARGLADLLLRCRASQTADNDSLLARLQARCQQRAHLFDEATERTALVRLVGELMSDG